MATPDPTGGIGEAAKELLEEMQKAQSEAQEIGDAKGSSGNATFDATLQQLQDAQHTQEVNKVQAAEQARVADRASNVLLQARDNVNISDMNHTTVGHAERVEESKLAGMLENLVKGQDRMNSIMKMALSGRSFSPPELIAMQAGVYRFTQELELTSKVVEKATSGIKQTINTQV